VLLSVPKVHQKLKRVSLSKSKKLVERNSVASAEFEVKRQYHREKWLQIVREIQTRADLNYGGWVNIPVPGYAGMTGSGGRKTPLQRNTFRLTVMLIGKLGQGNLTAC